MAGAHFLARFREAGSRLGLRNFLRRPPTPGNWRTDAATPEQIAADAAYAVGCARSYLAQCDAVGLALNGAAILELGPGPAFGAAAYLASYGARPAVADRWLAPFRSEYHPRYYAAVAALAADDPRATKLDAVRALAAATSYDGGPITLLSHRSEDLKDRIASPTYDAVVSNAVLEHVEDLDRTAAALFAVTRNGGYGFHQIDYRDHRNFDRPLDHLMFRPAAWRALSSSVHWEYGSQRRPSDYRRAFETAGFSVERYTSNLSADAAYLEEIARRLRGGTEQHDLADLSGFFVLRRPAASG